MSIFDERRKGGSSGGGFRVSSSSYSSPSSFDDELKNRIDNARKRLEHDGFTTDTDGRGAVEKALGLKKGNILFNTLEFLDKGRNGVANAIDGAQTNSGKGILKEFGEGFTGKEEVLGSKLLENAGVENKYVKGVGGLVLDVLTDPLTYLGGAGLIKAGVQKGAKTVAKQAAKHADNPLVKATTNANDKLGKIFNYGGHRTLDGKKSMGLKEIEDKARSEMSYWDNKIMKDVQHAAQEAGGLEKGTTLAKLMEAGQAGDDKAATILRNLFTNLREYGGKNGIDIKDAYGDKYVPKVMTDEAKEAAFKRSSGSGISKIGGDDRVLTRNTQGTISENNAWSQETFGNKMFDDNAFTASAEGVRRQANYVAAEKMKREILDNTDFAYKVNPGEKIALKEGQVEISPDEYNFLKGDIPGQVTQGATKGDGPTYIVTKEAKELLDNYKKKTVDDGMKEFMEGYDKVHNMWKKTALFSVGFHTRNAVGNNFNMFIGGMRPDDLVKYNAVAIKDLTKKLPDLQKKKRLGQPLAKADEELLREYDEFLQKGLKESSVYENEFRFEGAKSALEGALRPKGDKVKDAFNIKNQLNSKGVVNQGFEASRAAGIRLDELSRYAMFKWAKSQGKSPDEAAKIVKQTLFDYSDLSETERKIFKRVAPFYTWMRKNTAFQLQNFATQPHKYNWANNAIKEGMATAEMDPNLVADWQKESMNIPIPWSGDEEGNGTFLSANLPAADLGKLTNPSQLLTESLTPLIKLPLEFGTNTNFFSGQPIKEFDGQKKNIGPVEMDAGLQHALSQIGALRNLGKRSEDFANQDFGQMLSGGIFKEHNAEKQQTSKRYEELKSLEELLNLYEQTYGQRPTSVRDIGR